MKAGRAPTPVRSRYLASGPVVWVATFVCTTLLLLALKQALWLVVPFLMAIILYYVLFPAVRFVTLKGVDRETAAAIVAGATLVIGIAALVLAPISAALLQASLSRRREYLADSSAAEITGDPEGLARALAKLGNDKRPLRYVTRATAHLYIESPLRDNVGLRSSLGGLFDTHPPLEDRIARLREYDINRGIV